MSGLGRAFRAEWLRLAGGRAPWLLLVAAVLGAAYALGLAAAVAGGVMGAPSGFFLAAAACSGAALTSAAVGALHAAGAVAGDQASGLLRAVLCRPVDRGAWLTGRLAALAIGQCLVFLSAGAGALAVGLWRFGAGPTSDGGYVLAGSGFLAGQLLVAVALSLLAQAAAVVVGGVVGIVVGRPGGAVVAAGLLAAGLLAVTRWPRAERLVPLPTVTAALDRVAELAQGIAAHRAGDGALQAAAVCVVWLGLALAVGSAALARTDVVS